MESNSRKRSDPDPSMFDSLTGVFPRQVFFARLAEAALASALDNPLSLVMFDIDYLKRINLSHGYAAGDRVLSHIGGLIPTDAGVVACRSGGGEFLVLLTGLDEMSSLQYAIQLCDIVASNPLIYEGQTIPVTISLGVTTTLTQMTDSVLYEQSVGALYAAKAGGRNRAFHFRLLERDCFKTGEDIRIQTFEAMQRVVTERAERVITERRRELLLSLVNQGERDGLTGLFNRGYLDRRIAHHVYDAHRSNQTLCVALFDIDYFSRINLLYGWPVGDQALREVAELVRRNVRENDWVARYGGEEIAVVLPDCSSSMAFQVAERVRQAIAAHSFTNNDGIAFSVTTSAGVAELKPGEQLMELWKRVSGCTLAAKAAGKNRVLHESDLTLHR